MLYTNVHFPLFLGWPDPWAAEQTLFRVERWLSRRAGLGCAWPHLQHLGQLSVPVIGSVCEESWVLYGLGRGRETSVEGGGEGSGKMSPGRRDLR